MWQNVLRMMALYYVIQKIVVSVKYLWENKIAKEGHPLLQ